MNDLDVSVFFELANFTHTIIHKSIFRRGNIGIVRKRDS